MEGNFRALASRHRPGGRSLADLGYTDGVSARCLINEYITFVRSACASVVVCSTVFCSLSSSKLTSGNREFPKVLGCATRLMTDGWCNFPLSYHTVLQMALSETT